MEISFVFIKRLMLNLTALPQAEAKIS